MRSNKKATIGLLAVTVSLLLAWMLLSIDSSPGDGLATPAETATRSADGRAAAVAEEPERRERITDEAVPEDPGAIPPEAGANALTLLVRDGPSGPPVPDCAVWVLDDRDRRDSPTWEALEHDHGERICRLGTEHRTDAGGRLALVVDQAASGKSHWAHARLGSRCATMLFRLREGDTVELVLRPDHTLRVVVVDADGAPAPGIELHWLPIVAGRVTFRARRPIGVTDARGELVIHETDRRLELRGAQGVRIQAGTTGHAAVDLPERPAPGTTVTLRLPPTGALHVVLRRSAAFSPAPSWTVRLRPVLRDGESAGIETRMFPEFSSVVGPDAVARFDGVEVGRSFVSGLGIAGDGIAHTRVDGPRHAGEVRRVELQLPEDLVFVTGILTGPTGERLLPAEDSLAEGRLAFQARETPQDPWTNHAQMTVTGNGEISAAVRRRWFDPRFVDRRILWNPMHHLISIPPGTIAIDSARLPAPPAGTLDLGELRLVLHPVIVAGRVVAGSCETLVFHVETLRGEAGDADWTRVYRLHHVVDGDRFTIRGELPDDAALRLRVEDHKHCHVPPAPLPFAAGADDLAIELEPSRTLDIHLTVPAWFEGARESAPWLRPQVLVLRATGGRAAQRTDLADGIPLYAPEGVVADDVWHYRTSGLLPGDYTLALRAGNQATPVADVRIDAAAEHRQTLEADMASLLRKVVLRARAGDDLAPVKSAIVEPADGPPRSHVQWVDPTRSPLVLAVPAAGIDLRIRSSGGREDVIEGLSADREVVLHGSVARLDVVAPALQGLPEGIRAHVTASGRKTRIVGGKAVCPLLDRGTVHWSVTLRDVATGRRRTVARGSLEVSPDDHHHVEPSIDEAKLAETLRELGR